MLYKQAWLEWLRRGNGDNKGAGVGTYEDNEIIVPKNGSESSSGEMRAKNPDSYFGNLLARAAAKDNKNRPLIGSNPNTLQMQAFGYYPAIKNRNGLMSQDSLENYRNYRIKLVNNLLRAGLKGSFNEQDEKLSDKLLREGANKNQEAFKTNRKLAPELTADEALKTSDPKIREFYEKLKKNRMLNLFLDHRNTMADVGKANTGEATV